MSAPNMREIAAAAGVSKSTVSLALRDDPRLAEATRLRVQEVAAKLGYRRNAVVAHLMSQLRASKTPRFQANLAFLNCSRDPKILQWHTFRDFREGAKARGWQFGYGMEDFWLWQPGVSISRLFSILRVRNIRGLLLCAVLDLDLLRGELADGLAENAVAVLGVNATNHGFACALVDHFQVAHEAILNAHRLGYRRPALVVAESLDQLLGRRVSSGFRAGAIDLPGMDAPLVHAYEEGGKARLLAWAREARPDFILTAHEPVLGWLREDGWDIPGQLGLAHLDLVPEREGWAGINQENRVVGANAADIAIAQINRNERGPSRNPKMMLTKGLWTEGPTLVQRAAATARR